MDHGSERARRRNMPRRYRVLAEQTHSVFLERSTSFPVTVAGYDCAVYLKPARSDPSEQRTRGVGFAHLEFTSETKDLVRAASCGMSLIETVLAGLGVAADVPFGLADLVQILDVTTTKETRFLSAITHEYRHCDEPITENQLRSLERMLAHWDGLENAARIRRAASLYRRALQEAKDEVAAFQYGYMGLEALEPVLAEQEGVNPGVEITKDTCKHCGVEYEKRRTVLNGVRAYITRPEHRDGKEARDREWKVVNEFRHDLFHSRKDWQALSSRALDALPAVAHFLHDAICCVSHAHDLEAATYRLPRNRGRLAFVGNSKPGIDDSIEECRPVVELQDVVWTRHPEHQWLPEVRFVNSRLALDISGEFYRLPDPLECESEACLERLNIEAG